MSKKVIEIIEGIFNKLIDFTDDDDKYRIANTKRYLQIEDGLRTTVKDVVSKAQFKVIKTNFVYLLTARYQEERYVVFPNKYSEILEVLDLKKVDDNAIEQGIGILALGFGCIDIKDGITSLKIIDECLELEDENGLDHVDFTYSQILEFFEEFIVVIIEDSSFKVEYDEDFFRIYAIMLTIESNNTLTEKTFENFRELLFLESSRSISISIISIIQGGINEHKFLELYQCIEYLFIIMNAREIAIQYNIDNNKAVDIVINEHLRSIESSKVIAKYASETSVINFYEVLLDEGDCKNKSEKVSAYIYSVRCNIAHLRYKQEQLLENVKWKVMLEYVSNIVLSIYEKMDGELVQLCQDTNAWTPLFKTILSDKVDLPLSIACKMECLQTKVTMSVPV